MAGMKSDQKVCPDCGAPIPVNAPQGLCPKCLLAGAAIPTESGPASAKLDRPPAPAVAQIGDAFPQLEIIELIGQGGMGFVYHARQPKLERDVALKILPQHLAEDAKFAERFAREGRLLAKLNHPNIVSVYDFGEAGGFFYLLMEFVDGVNLRQAMRASQFTPAQALSIVPAICEALQFAHDEGVLHRDIKPENILLDTKGRVKIADFGIAKLVGRGSASRSAAGSERDIKTTVGDAGQPGEIASITGLSSTLGTPQYMAPEQLERPADVDHRADIYSLGVVFYELLTGELSKGKFARPSAKTPLDERVDQIVLRALEKEREHRQQSARQLKTEVETVLRVQPAQSATPTRFDRISAIAFAVALYYVGLVAGVPLVRVFNGGPQGIMFLLFAWGLAVASFILRKYDRTQSEQTREHARDLLQWAGNLWAISAGACLPVCGFGLFFLVGLAVPRSGWRPAVEEALIVPVAIAGMALLPWANYRLWELTRRSKPVSLLNQERDIVTLGGILFLVLVVILAGGMYFLARRSAAATAQSEAWLTAQLLSESVQELESKRPVVVETVPRSGEREVEPGEVEIKARFSKAMLDNSWS